MSAGRTRTSQLDDSPPTSLVLPRSSTALHRTSLSPRVSVSPLRSNVSPLRRSDKSRLAVRTERLSAVVDKQKSRKSCAPARGRNMQLSSLFDSLTRFFSADTARRRRTAYVNATVSLAQASFSSSRGSVGAAAEPPTQAKAPPPPPRSKPAQDSLGSIGSDEGHTKAPQAAKKDKRPSPKSSVAARSRQGKPQRSDNDGQSLAEHDSEPQRCRDSSPAPRERPAGPREDEPAMLGSPRQLRVHKSPPPQQQQRAGRQSAGVARRLSEMKLMERAGWSRAHARTVSEMRMGRVVGRGGLAGRGEVGSSHGRGRPAPKNRRRTTAANSANASVVASSSQSISSVIGDVGGTDEMKDLMSVSVAEPEMKLYQTAQTIAQQVASVGCCNYLAHTSQHVA